MVLNNVFFVEYNQKLKFLILKCMHIKHQVITNKQQYLLTLVNSYFFQLCFKMIDCLDELKVRNLDPWF